MKTQFLIALLAILAPALAEAQAPPLDLLSPHAIRAEKDPADHGVARAAGMPLRDGVLAPGMLTVRVVRGSFDNNVAGQNVTVAVAGGKVETARTGSDGRAQFAHLPVGASVQAAATVDGVPLTSDAFDMPADSGVRLLLVVGDGPVNASGPPPDAQPRGVAPAAAAPAFGSVPAPDVEIVPPPVSTASGGSFGITVIRVIMATTTILAFLFIGFTRPGRRRASAADSR